MTKEDSLNIAVATYLRMQYPTVLFCHIPNGGYRNAREGAKFKMMGVRAGMPNILIFEKKNIFSGLFIELKIGKNKTTDSQNLVIKELIRLGWAGSICYTFEDAKHIIDNYLKN